MSRTALRGPMASRSKAPGAPTFTLRRATLADAGLLVRHRVAMFRQMGDQPECALARHAPSYLAWMVPRIASAEMVAWVAEDPAGRPLGSGAVWFQPSHPRPGIDDVRVPYVLSVYTTPQARGQGIATAIVRRAIDLAKRLGYARVSLHASRMGRGVYERVGFESTTELRYWIDPVQRRRTALRRASEAAESARRGAAARSATSKGHPARGRTSARPRRRGPGG
jgi:GNAT superfamily N-acetyltransferase